MCVNCNDQIFNGQPYIIPKPICKDCPETNVCSDGILSTDCVYSIKPLPCIGTEEGEQLSNILDKIETYICNPPSGSCCEVNTYTILDVCRTESSSLYDLTIVPNFTYYTPVTIFVSCTTDTDPFLSSYQPTFLGSVKQQLIEGVPIHVPYSSFDTPLSGNVTFQITDNLGNYSIPFIINRSNILACT